MDTNKFSIEMIRRLNEVRLAEVELNLIGQRLMNVATYERLAEHVGQKPGDYMQTLLERRKELGKKVQTPGNSGPPVDPSYSSFVDTQRSKFDVGGIIVLSWNKQCAPTMREGASFPPGTSGTGGDITTAGLFNGEVAYGGILEDTNNPESLDLQYWVHNWYYDITIPAPQSRSELYYRFTIEGELNLYRATVFMGDVSQFVTIITSPDANQPLNTEHWDFTGWTFFNKSVLTSLHFIGSIPIGGRMVVDKGKIPIIRVLVGATVGVSDGIVHILWGTIGTRLTLPRSATITSSAFGLIEYYYEPL
jgi:hypothetical protein